MAAGLAGALGVLGLSDAVAALSPARVVGPLADAFGPLLRAGRDGREPAPADRRRMLALAAGTLLVAGWLMAGPLAGLALACCAPAVAGALVRARRRRHAAAVGRAAPGLARTLADLISSGQAPRGALALAARGAGGALGAEVGRMGADLDAGATTEDALERLRKRAGRPEIDAIAVAILLHREAGGDLPAALRGVAGAAEASARLEADARAATAQARLTGQIVCGLPLAAAALAELARPGTIGDLLAAPLSGSLLLAAGVMQAGALFAIRRLARPAP